MIFKNLMLYQLTHKAEIYFPALREKLADSDYMPLPGGESNKDANQ